MKLEQQLGLKDDETLLAVGRRSAATLFLPFLLVAILVLLPFVFLVPLIRLGLYGFIIIGCFMLICVSIGMRHFLDWLNSYLAVTDKRLILVHQHGFLDRRVTELPYSRVQRVAYRVYGLRATIFKYGTLMIESAGSGEPLTMACMSNPARIQDLINELQSGAHGAFGDMLQAVSKLDPRQLALLKSEVERTVRTLPPREDA